MKSLIVGYSPEDIWNTDEMVVSIVPFLINLSLTKLNNVEEERRPRRGLPFLFCQCSRCKRSTNSNW